MQEKSLTVHIKLYILNDQILKAYCDIWGMFLYFLFEVEYIYSEWLPTDMDAWKIFNSLFDVFL